MGRALLLTVILYTATSSIAAQDISFFHLNKSHGLSDNRVQCTVTDKDGLLWIGTASGLNSYDGYTVKNFYSRDYPGLPGDVIVRMVCDNKNRIWIQCHEGMLGLLDEQRRFHMVNTLENGEKISVDYLLPFPDRVMFLSGGIIYGLKNTNPVRFAPVNMQKEPLLGNRFDRINRWDKNRLVFSGNNLMYLFNMRTLKASEPLTIPHVTAVARLGQNEAIVTCKGTEELCRVDLSSGRIVKKYTGLKDQYGEAMHPSPESIYHLEDQRFLISSPSAGVYVFDARSETLKRYRHDPADQRTIASNSSLYLFSDSAGFFYITNPNAGLDYFKLNYHQTAQTPVFRDKLTHFLYDGFISGIAEDRDGYLWLAARKYLMKWDTTTENVIFFLNENSKALQNRGGIRTIYVDEKNRTWLGLSGGVLILDAQGKLLKYLSVTGDAVGGGRDTGAGDEIGAAAGDRSGAGALPHRTVNKIIPGPDGRLWLCTTKGICFIDPESFNVTLPTENSPLGVLRDKHFNTLFFRSASEVWTGTWEGAYRIDLSSGATTAYTTENGLLFNEVIGFADDEEGNVYIGIRYGFHVLKPDGELLAYKQINDGRPIDCHSMVEDQSGNIWFANSDYLACYIPSAKSFKIYDERAGISNSGFYFHSAYRNAEGKLFFGTNKGITWFHPSAIRMPGLPVSVRITSLETPDSLYHLSNNPTITLPYSSNTVAFSFSAINLLRTKAIFYQFMLEGVDENWVKTSSSSQRVSYSKLEPGSYLFRIKASSDNIHWTEASSPARLYIRTPWWKSRWTTTAYLLAGICMAGTGIRQRRRRLRRQQEQLETEQAINYLSSSIYEQRTVDDILWDVAKNCIGRLKFEDCVIYLVDKKRNVLVQKAAWGPKTTPENKILNPLEIRVGKGIVGSVAQSGKAEIINDTSKDNRYILDDERRLSEITVPIVYNGNVLGIIDSEHSKKKFFTRKHLSILSTIASLCANKIVRLKAEEANQKAQLELLRHERETVEAQLKSLRLQMNPHFLFNSLNSIQQMILTGEDIAATRYLSKFSRLLRLVLIHSDKEMVTLKEELETLGLYVELEALRFKEAFRHMIECDQSIDPDEIKIPAMLIQPFAENAIWHGLMHKKGDRLLNIRFSEAREEKLVCCIEDNGIGRKAAGKINSGMHSGKGISVAEERLKTYNMNHSLKSAVLIEDLRDKDGYARGTRVTLTLPLL